MDNISNDIIGLLACAIPLTLFFALIIPLSSKWNASQSSSESRNNSEETKVGGMTSEDWMAFHADYKEWYKHFPDDDPRNKK